MITEFLEELERRLDPAIEEQLLTEWRQFVGAQASGPIFSPRRARQSPAGLQWPAVSVNEALEDFERMALQQLAGCSSQLASGSGQLLAVRCNYGTGILPTLFGAELFIMPPETNTLPTSVPLAGGLDAIRRLVAAGVPGLRRGLGGRTLDMGRYFVELLAPYPKVRRYVHIYHPDLQGPMDVCELLWGSSLFLDIVDHPELAKQLLDLVSSTYIAFLREWHAIVPPVGDSTVHWSMLHRGHIMLRDDSAMNFSPAMFEEFIFPYDQRLLHALGGGAMHFCGRGDHYIATATSGSGLYAVNLSQPEYNDMECIFSNTVDRGVALIGLARQAADAALARGRDLHGLVHCW